MDSKEIKRLASDTKPFTELEEVFTQKFRGINFNDQNTLLDLVQYTRYAHSSYGITSILDNFCKERTSNA